ncbi:MAG: VanZ family protein [Planctomycetaceae bacterium]|nr:VanZ family protein [Planctomycetaceae bacterium]
MMHQILPSMRWPYRLIQCVATIYLIVLTLFLVHPDAFSLFGAGAKAAEAGVDATVHGLLQHFSAYFLLGTLLRWAFVGARVSTRTVLIFLVLHGATTETIQAFVPNRTADWRDLLANISGVVASVAVYALCRRWTESPPRIRPEVEHA